MTELVAVGKQPSSPTTNDRRIRPIFAVRGSFPGGFAKRQLQGKEKIDHLVLLNRPTTLVDNDVEKLATVQTSKKVGVLKRSRAMPQRSPPQQSREIFASIIMP